MWDTCSRKISSFLCHELLISCCASICNLEILCALSFFQFLSWFLSNSKINCLFFLMKHIPLWACLSICHTVFYHRFHNSILCLSYLLPTLLGGLHAYFDKDITTLLFLNWIKNNHDDLEDVKNYIGFLNKNILWKLLVHRRKILTIQRWFILDIM